MQVYILSVVGAFTVGFFFGDVHGFIDGLMVLNEFQQ